MRLLLIFLLCLPALAGDLSRAEFQNLAEELAMKVNLFRDTWEKDPGAEFYGGTTRDYLYWLLGELKQGRTPEELRKLKAIDVREFIIGDSDVDIVSEEHLDLSPERYGVKKIDSIDADRFKASTDAGKNELQQGFIPVEKIRLGKDGFKTWRGVGNGINEIYTGKLSVHFATPEEFAGTHYAKQKLNHPVLLALRYLRLVAIDYGKRHGQGYPDTKKLLALVDPKVRDVIRDARLDGYPDKFWEWANGTIKKAFLSYTNPTAAKVLFDTLGVRELIARHAQLKGYNQFLFSRYPDPKRTAANLKKYSVDAGSFFTPAASLFPDGQL